jgi:hypothetical protein
MTQRLVGRDQGLSAFSATLARFCDATGARGAALVDREGEAVDYAGALSPYDIRVAGAELRLLLRVAQDSRCFGWAATRELILRATKRSFLAVSLSDGYALVAVLPRGCFACSERGLTEALTEICAEAGLEALDGAKGRWHRVEVRTEPSNPRRPTAVWYRGEWCALTVIGRYRTEALGRREVGFRVRLTNDAELTLVRERLGRWYAEQ